MTGGVREAPMTSNRALNYVADGSEAGEFARMRTRQALCPKSRKVLARRGWDYPLDCRPNQRSDVSYPSQRLPTAAC